MSHIEDRIKELRRRGLKLDQTLVDKYLIHPGQEFSPERLPEVPVAELESADADLDGKEE